MKKSLSSQKKPSALKPLPIQSESNEKFKIWKSLLNSKGIKKENLAILSGKKLTEEFLKESPENVSAKLISNDHLAAEDYQLSLLQSQTSGVHTFVLDKKLFAELDELGTHQPLLIVETPELKKWTPELSKSGLTVFLPLGNPGNLGAAIRSAWSFEATEVVLLKESANPFLPKSIKGSAGSVFTAPIFEGPTLSDLAQLLPDEEILGLDLDGENLEKLKWPKKSYLIVGEEGQGLQKLGQYRKISIPMKNTESLNATVALSIALYDWKIKSTK